MPRRTKLTKAALETLRTDLASCERGDKTAVIERAAKLLGMHPSTLRKHLLTAGVLTKCTPRKRDPGRPEYREWTRVLVALQAKAPDGSIPMQQCLDAAVADGLLPTEAALVDVAQYYRIARELGLRDNRRRHHRLHADYGYQAVLFDASTSANWIVERRLDDGDYLLRLHHAPYSASGYKNKPLGKDRLRCVVYATWDMHSGHQLARYVAARGESGVDAMDYLCWAMAPKDDERFPVEGRITDLWSDQGAVTKHGGCRDLLDRLGVEVKKGKPYAKERMGGVEQTHRRRWQSFERQFFLYVRAKERLEITLSELNRQLMNYLAKVNDRPSRADRRLTRTQAWVRSVNARGGLPALPPDPMETIAMEAPRVLSAAGIFSWANVEYEVKEIHDRPVVARRHPDGDRVVVYDPETGEVYDAHPYQPRAYGEVRTGATPPAERAAEAGAEVRLGVTVYGGEEGGNVAQFPARKQPAEPLHDPLDASRYQTLSAALAAFHTLYGVPLDPTTRTRVEELLTKRGLDKAFVRELALDMRNFLTQQQATTK